MIDEFPVVCTVSVFLSFIRIIVSAFAVLCCLAIKEVIVTLCCTIVITPVDADNPGSQVYCLTYKRY